MCTDCTQSEGPQISDIARAAAPRGRLIGGNEKVAREKAAIDGILEANEISLSVVNDLVEELFNKFSPVLSREDGLAEQNPVPEQPYYGSSQVFVRLQDQFFRTNNIAEKLRILRRVAEV